MSYNNTPKHVACVFLIGKAIPSTNLDRLLGLQKIETPRISRKSAQEGGKVVSPTRRPPLQTRRYPWY